MSMIYSFFEADQSVSGTTVGEPAISGELSNFTRTFGKNKRYVIPDSIDGALLVFNPDDAVDVEWNWNNIATLNTAISDLESMLASLDDSTTTASVMNHVEWTDPNVVIAVSEDMYLFDGKLIPGWIDLHTNVTAEVTIRVFLVNSVLDQDYPLGHFTIVPPLLEDESRAPLHGNYNLADLATDTTKFGALKTVMATINPFSWMGDRFNEQTGDQIFSDTHNLTVLFHNPEQADDTFETTWVIGCNGKAGCADSDIRSAMWDYILGLYSEVTDPILEKWRLIAPSLVEINTFYIDPHWDSVIDSGVSGITALYSPSLNLEDVVAIKEDIIDDEGRWGAINIDPVNTSGPKAEDKFQILTSNYRGLMFSAIPAYGNPEGRKKFTELYPGYTLYNDLWAITSSASTTSNGRMLLAVRNALEAAESFIYTGTSLIPAFADRKDSSLNGVKCLVVRVNELQLYVRLKNQG